MGNEIKDETTEVIEAAPDDDKAKDDKAGKEDKKADKDSKGALSDAEDTTKAIQGFLEENDITSPDQLKELLDLKARVGGADLDELEENSALLKKYQKHWAKEEESKREDDETPEETIARVKNEKANLEKALKSEQSRQEEAQESQELLKTFNNTVSSALEAEKDLPKEYLPFLKEFMGVDNPINEVGLDDKKSIKKIAKNSVKKILAFEQLAIKSYQKGKADVPAISTSTETPSDAPPKITKEKVRAVMTERLKGFLKK